MPINHKKTDLPVIVLGGGENALSIGRSLSSHGVSVYVAAKAQSTALYSRYFKDKFVCPLDQDIQIFWQELLLSQQGPVPRGTIIYPCTDESLEFLAVNSAELVERYTLYEHKPELIECMLDKQRTLDLAHQVGVPAPKFWPVNSASEAEAIDDVMYPVMIKPIHSHLFQRVYKRKLLIVENEEQLHRKLDEVLSHNLKVMLCEIIPGPDTLLSSYYTFIDNDENLLFHFTKRMIRRDPVNYGGGCYHITKWEPETAEMGRRFFNGVSFCGLGNIEFKYDTRDEKLKVIEVNSRFTAAQELLHSCGMDTAYIIYCHLTNQQLPKHDSFIEGMRLWYPMKDFRSFLELNKRGELNFTQWLVSIAHPHVFSRFRITDPLPSLHHVWKKVSS